MNQNYYQILEISQNASKEEIQEAFKKLSTKYHPDHNKDPLASEKFQQILKAYEVLSNEVKKEVYDEALNILLNQNKSNNQNTINNQNINQNSIPEFKEQDFQNQQNNQELNLPNLNNKKKHSGLGRAGAILNIIGAVFLLIFLFWTIVFIPFWITTIVTNSNYLKGKNNKVSAGVWGLLFGSFIGGIFILIAD